jgi:membrane protease YdiL (CAAX protease family)
MLAIVGMVVVEAICWALAFGIKNISTALFWVLCCASTIVFAIACCVWAGTQGLLGPWVALVPLDLVWGLAGAAAQYGLAYLAVKYLVPRFSAGPGWIAALHARLAGAQSANKLVAFVGLMATCSGEEFIWRGFATDVASAHYGPVVAFVVQVAANTALYVPMGILTKNPIIPCSGLIGGVATGLIAVWLDGRLIAPSLAHGLFDFTIVILRPLF